MANDVGPPRAQRGAQRHLAAAAAGPHQHQGGDIGAGEQKHDSHGGNQDEQCGADVGDDLFLHGLDQGGDIGVELWILLLQSLSDRGDFGARLLWGDIGFEPRNRQNAGMPAPIVGQGAGPRLERQNRVRGLLQDFKIRRHYADDGVGLIVQSNGPAEHVRRGRKPLLPETVTDEGDGRAAGFVFLGRKGAAEFRPDSQ